MVVELLWYQGDTERSLLGKGIFIYIIFFIPFLCGHHSDNVCPNISGYGQAYYFFFHIGLDGRELSSVYN